MCNLEKHIEYFEIFGPLHVFFTIVEGNIFNKNKLDLTTIAMMTKFLPS
jgi:hypothetical protein